MKSWARNHAQVQARRTGTDRVEKNHNRAPFFELLRNRSGGAVAVRGGRPVLRWRPVYKELFHGTHNPTFTTFSTSFLPAAATRLQGVGVPAPRGRYHGGGRQHRGAPAAVAGGHLGRRARDGAGRRRFADGRWRVGADGGNEGCAGARPCCTSVVDAWMVGADIAACAPNCSGHFAADGITPRRLPRRMGAQPVA